MLGAKTVVSGGKMRRPEANSSISLGLVDFGGLAGDRERFAAGLHDETANQGFLQADEPRKQRLEHRDLALAECFDEQLGRDRLNLGELAGELVGARFSIDPT